MVFWGIHTILSNGGYSSGCFCEVPMNRGGWYIPIRGAAPPSLFGCGGGKGCWPSQQLLEVSRLPRNPPPNWTLDGLIVRLPPPPPFARHLICLVSGLRLKDVYNYTCKRIGRQLQRFKLPYPLVLLSFTVLFFCIPSSLTRVKIFSQMVCESTNIYDQVTWIYSEIF